MATLPHVPTYVTDRWAVLSSWAVTVILISFRGCEPYLFSIFEFALAFRVIELYRLLANPRSRQLGFYYTWFDCSAAALTLADLLDFGALWTVGLSCV